MFTHAFDVAVLQFFQGVESPLMDAAMTTLTKLGDHGIIWITVCLALLAYRPTRLWGVMAAVALSMSFFVDEILLKSIFLRERPFVAFPGVELIIDPPSGFSFPSSHSATAFAVASCLFLCPRIRLPFRALLLGSAALIAFSRVYLSVHYFTDVMFGTFVGIVCGVLFGVAACHLQRQPWEEGVVEEAAPTP